MTKKKIEFKLRWYQYLSIFIVIPIIYYWLYSTQTYTGKSTIFLIFAISFVFYICFILWNAEKYDLLASEVLLVLLVGIIFSFIIPLFITPKLNISIDCVHNSVVSRNKFIITNNAPVAAENVYITAVDFNATKMYEIDRWATKLCTVAPTGQPGNLISPPPKNTSPDNFIIFGWIITCDILPPRSNVTITLYSNDWVSEFNLTYWNTNTPLTKQRITCK